MLNIPRRVHDRDVAHRDAFGSATHLACHLVRVSDPTTIRSVTVVGGRRLTGPELLRLHAEAGLSHVLLTMDNAGTVRVRRTTTSHSRRADPVPDLSPETEGGA